MNQMFTSDLRGSFCIHLDQYLQDILKVGLNQTETTMWLVKCLIERISRVFENRVPSLLCGLLSQFAHLLWYSMKQAVIEQCGGQKQVLSKLQGEVSKCQNEINVSITMEEKACCRK